MDNNFIMSTSVLQYLEDIGGYLRESHASKSKDKFELLSEHHPLDEPDEFRDLVFDHEQGQNIELDKPENEIEESIHNFSHKLSIYDEPADMEEDKYEGTLFGKEKSNRTKIDSKSDESNNKEEGSKKPRVSNKERARKARQRKKKYYEDLEKRVEYLEKKNQKLNKENDYLREKLKIYENGARPEMPSSSVFKEQMLENIVKKIKDLPDDSHIMMSCSEIAKKYGPYGCEKIKIMESSFDMILENML